MNGTKMLSGENLVIKASSKRASSLPTRGLKNVVSCGSYVEAHQVAETLRIRKELLQEERVEKWGVLSQAEWIEEKRMALVTKQHGGHWSYMGHPEFGNKLYLYAEETLYLLEVNSLQLRYGGVLVSFQQAYALLFEDGWAVQAYKVYSSLCRKGYKLLRHSGPRVSEDGEKSEDAEILDETVENLSSKSNHESEDWRTYPVILIEGETDTEESEEKSCDEFEINPKQLSITWPDTDTVMENVDLTTDNDRPSTSMHEQERDMEVECLDSDNDCEIIELPCSRVTEEPHCRNSFKNSSNKTQCSKDLNPLIDKNLLPNLFGKKLASFEAPPPSLLPPNIHLNKKFYHFNLKNTHKRLLSNQNENLSNDTDMRIAIKEQNVRSITTGDNLPEERPKNNNRVPQNTTYHRSTRHIPYIHPFRGSQFHAQHSPFYQFNQFISNPFQAGYFQSHFRHQNAIGLQNSLLHQYGSQFRRPQQFPVKNYLTNASVNRNVGNKPQSQHSSTMSNSECEKMTQMKKQTKHLQLIKQCAIKCKELSNKQALPNTVRLLQSLLCTYNDKYKDFIFLNRDYEIEHAANENLSSDSDYTATDFDSGKRRKRIKMKRQKRPKESNDVYCLTSSDDDCIPITTENLYDNNTNRAKNLKMGKKNNPAVCDKHSRLLAVFNGWMSSDCSDFGRPAVNINSVKRNLICKTQENVLFYQYVNCVARNRFENWGAIKAAFKRSLAGSVLFSSEDKTHDNKCDVTAAIKCDKIKSLLRPEDCKSLCSVLNRIRIIKSGDMCDALDLKIFYDVYLRTEKCLRSSPPPPAFRVVCLNESEPIPEVSSIALYWSQCGDQIPLVFAVVGRDAISYVQMGPVDIPTLGLQ